MIVQKFGLTPDNEVTQVEQGQADWVFDQIPAGRLNEISTKYPDQVHINQLTQVEYFAFNTRIPPFNNLKARQAVNFATDRNALVKIFGGPRARGADLPGASPSFPGYEPYCPYTINPGSGKWTGPDMNKAKQLMAQSGTKGAVVKVEHGERRPAEVLRPLLRRPAEQARVQGVAAGALAGASSTPTSRTRRTRSSSRIRTGSRTTRRLPTSSTSSSAAARSTRTATRARTSPRSATRRSSRRWTRRARPASLTKPPQTASGHRSTRRSPTRRRGSR